MNTVEPLSMKNASPRVLIVEDDRITSARLSANLQMNKMFVREASSIQAARQLMNQEIFDILVLDIELPDGTGLQLIESVRSQGKGIICISVKSQTIDRLTALNLGADDYMVKPVAGEELALKVRNLHDRLMRYAPATDNTRKIYQFSQWECDPLARSVHHADGSLVELTPGEFSVLLVFLKQPKTCLSRDHIMTQASTLEHIASDRSIDIMVHRLRKKFSIGHDQQDIFITVYGAGYLFNLRVNKIMADLSR